MTTTTDEPTSGSDRCSEAVQVWYCVGSRVFLTEATVDVERDYGMVRTPSGHMRSYRASDGAVHSSRARVVPC